MGDDEGSTPPKSSKSPAAAQETPSTPSYSDWSTSMQAYYGAGTTPPPFFPPPVASPPPHPYMWGGQHPMMPPYGTPLPYPALYPHGALFAHPSMATGIALPNTDMAVKTSNGKEPASIKKSKTSPGNMGLISGKSGESRKAASVSGNDAASQSGESGSEASSDATDENADQASSAANKRSFNPTDGSNAKSNSPAQHTGGNHSASAPGKLLVPMPTAGLNIGMDLWNATAPGGTSMRTRPHSSNASPQVASATIVGHEGMLQDHQSTQDEREIKRQRRKQSNRESARRSRLRKQAECEELQSKVESLSNENQMLKEELQKLAEQCENLTSENNSIMEELTRLYGPEATSSLQGNDHDPFIGEDNGHVKDASLVNNSNPTADQNGKLSSNGKI